MVLQRTRCFKKVHFLSDCLCMDGRTVYPSMLTKLEGRSTRKFSIERPTRGMLDTWKLALISITSSRYTCESPLGNFLVHPHNNANWYASEDEKHIYHFLDDNNFVSHSLPSNSRHTGRQKYLRNDSSPANVCRLELKLASVFASPDKKFRQAPLRCPATGTKHFSCPHCA